jgi:hypothetical protein
MGPSVRRDDETLRRPWPLSQRMLGSLLTRQLLRLGVLPSKSNMGPSVRRDDETLCHPWPSSQRMLGSILTLHLLRLGCTAKQRQHESQCSPGRRNPPPPLAVIPAHAGIHLDSAFASLGLYCQAKARRVPVFAGTTTPFAWNMQLTRAPTRCGHFFATHLDSVAPQRVPPLIHMLIDRPSTPGVDNPDTDPSPPGQKFATHLDRPAAQGVDAVIHMVSQTRSTRHVDKPERGTCDRPLQERCKSRPWT